MHADRVRDATTPLTPGDWARVRGLAEDALAMPREARRAFLDPRCVDDPALRERVERLVASCERVDEDREFLARPAGELVAPLVADIARAERAPARLDAALAERYRIEREIGVGGTATVYLARDVRHARSVAIKVMHPEVAAALGVERFLREIRTTAALQHPHILPLFDSGNANGLLFYVMPFVADSLRARLVREGRLGVTAAIRIACEVAGAIDYAHRHGVIHRDIKPENILLHEGRPVVADFGIAVAGSEAAGADARRLTQPGRSIGTPRYMSPEQTRGERHLTAQSDVHALGVLTYEMLTGAPPFTGESTDEVVQRVRGERPLAMGPHRREVPRHVEVAVLTALAKAPAERFATAAELARALEGDDGARASRAIVGIPAAGSPPIDARRVRSLVGGLTALVVALAGVAAWGWSRAAGGTAAVPSTVAGENAGDVVRFTLLPPSGYGIASSSPTRDLALSPDGRLVVYAASGPDGIMRLHARALDDEATHVIAGTEGASWPFFSPDGRSIGFRSHGRLRTMDVAGDGPRALGAIAAGAGGAAWTSRGVIVIAAADGLYTIADTGGAATLLAPAEPGEAAWANPVALPDGDHVLYSSVRGRQRTIGIASLSAHSTSSLHVAGSAPLGVIDEHAVYATEDEVLMAVPFDMTAMRATGAAVPVATDVRVESTGVAQAALSRSGTLAYRRGSRLMTTQPGILVVHGWASELRAGVLARGWAEQP